MDYSYVSCEACYTFADEYFRLLLGIDEERKQIACGLVDTIGMLPSFLMLTVLWKTLLGSYTFAKTLEYKAKQNLSSGKEVTVIPPNEYQERFLNAMDNYFVACPGMQIALHRRLYFLADSQTR